MSSNQSQGIGRGLDKAQDLDRHARAVEDLAQSGELLSALEELGICSGFQHLRNDVVNPEACMRSANTRLRFCGYGGSKWRNEDWFVECLDNLRAARGEVQFLLPRDQLNAAAIADYRELMKNWSDVFAVRFYTSEPTFRIVIVDDRWTLLSHYRYGQNQNNTTNELGWEIPQILFDNSRKHSLGKALMVYFGQMWTDAEGLEPSDVEERRRRLDGFGGGA